MARRVTTLSGRLILVMLLIHAVLLPVLFFALDTVVKRINVNRFVDDVRIQGRVFADNLEKLVLDGSRQQIVAQLDSAVLGGQVVYAELQQGNDIIISSLMVGSDTARFDEDFAFGDHGDDIYYLSLPIVTADAMAILRLGFDEVTIRLHFEEVRRSIIMVIGAYLLITVLAMIFMGAHVVRPIKWLQQASRRIASGEYEKKLDTGSRLAEIQDLSVDLEHMRSNLVGINARLQDEIAEREVAESRKSLKRWARWPAALRTSSTTYCSLCCSMQTWRWRICRRTVRLQATSSMSSNWRIAPRGSAVKS